MISISLKSDRGGGTPPTYLGTIRVPLRNPRLKNTTDVIYSRPEPCREMTMHPFVP